MAYTLDFQLNLGLSNTGLTLEAQLINSTGGNVGAAITTGFFEVGAGNYLWHTTAMPDGFRGGVIFRVSPAGAIKTFVAVNPQEAENNDVKVSTLPTSAASLTAAAVWVYPTRTLTTAVVAVDPPALVFGDVIRIRRGDTIGIPFSGLGSLTGRTKLWFSVKRETEDTDNEAIIQIEESGGLLRLNGGLTVSSLGSLVVANAAAGDVNVLMSAELTRQLKLASAHCYDVQVLTAGVVTTLTQGQFAVYGDVTAAVS